MRGVTSVKESTARRLYPGFLPPTSLSLHFYPKSKIDPRPTTYVLSSYVERATTIHITANSSHTMSSSGDKETNHKGDEIFQLSKKRQREHEYRQLYSALLRKHKGIFDDNNSTDEDPEYAQEQQELQEIMTQEATNLVSGLAVAGLAFGVLRKGPRLMAKFFMKSSSKTKFEQADHNARRRGTWETQQFLQVMLEGAFSCWFGYRAYNHLSHASTQTYDRIADLPLVAGKSRIASALCSDWIDVSQDQVSTEFWNDLNNHNAQGEEENNNIIRDPQTWQAIQRFTENCILREEAEQNIRQEQGLASSQAVALPKRLVNSAYRISNNEAEELTRDVRWWCT